ncbi:aldo/keto reductase [Paenibacillus sp. HB172176]|uniref:aldo/keto reductase n=1 Tax=Paenibacillus sp. HB172176 TaxID=2493690 RepID=UPI00143BE98E|nr:aldo/keto reductase [Paenibacillus sp. HB172176]
MRFRELPGTDLESAVIGLGTVGFGSKQDEESSFALLDRYVELGGNFIDTANIYADFLGGEKGLSEKTIGRWLSSRGSRSDVILSTKGAHPPFDGSSRKRLDAASIASDLHESLERLQTDRIDLYFLHRDDPDMEVRNIMDALHEHVAAGEIRYIGASNWKPARIEEANRYAREIGKTPFVASQPHWNLASLNPGAMAEDMTAVDDEAYAYYVGAGLAVFAYSSQAGGFFSGRYGRGTRPDSGSAGHVEKMYANEESYRRLERVQELAAELGVSPSQVTLAYLTSQPFPVIALAGVTKLAYLEDSCKAGDLKLTDEQLSYLVNG